jgi:hypothetical protein
VDLLPAIHYRNRSSSLSGMPIAPYKHMIQVFFSYLLIGICIVLLVGGLGLLIHGALGFMRRRTPATAPPQKSGGKGKESLNEMPSFKRSA